MLDRSGLRGRSLDAEIGQTEIFEVHSGEIEHLGAAAVVLAENLRVALRPVPVRMGRDALLRVRHELFVGPEDHGFLGTRLAATGLLAGLNHVEAELALDDQWIV